RRPGPAAGRYPGADRWAGRRVHGRPAYPAAGPADRGRQRDRADPRAAGGAAAPAGGHLPGVAPGRRRVPPGAGLAGPGARRRHLVRHRLPRRPRPPATLHRRRAARAGPRRRRPGRVRVRPARARHADRPAAARAAGTAPAGPPRPVRVLMRRALAALQRPEGHGESVRINKRAGPVLRQEALTAQSAAIDTVSGATYTSQGYRTSLQGALATARA